MTIKQRKDIDGSISFFIKHCGLDENLARQMSYKKKQEYLDWSEGRADSAADNRAEDIYEENPEEEARRGNPDLW